ncbi:hypothetical protein IAR50_005313 [Cryptococcus sp. DSM 104548]
MTSATKEVEDTDSKETPKQNQEDMIRKKMQDWWKVISGNALSLGGICDSPVWPAFTLAAAGTLMGIPNQHSTRSTVAAWPTLPYTDGSIGILLLIYLPNDPPPSPRWALSAQQSNSPFPSDCLEDEDRPLRWGAFDPPSPQGLQYATDGFEPQAIYFLFLEKLGDAVCNHLDEVESLPLMTKLSIQPSTRHFMLFGSSMVTSSAGTFAGGLTAACV